MYQYTQCKHVHRKHLQYNELVELDQKYKDLVIIGAPCNQFGSQEPGTNAEIKKFAAARGAKFPLLSKLDVNGPDGALHSMIQCLS
jgi:glutathione peroxidase